MNTNITVNTTFGFLCFSYIPQMKRDKLDKKAEAEIFIGYRSISKAYRIFLPQRNNVIINRMFNFFSLIAGIGRMISNLKFRNKKII